MYTSISIREAQTQEAVVEMINQGGITEGMEGVEFGPDQLAGQYAWDAQSESDCEVDKAGIEAHLEILSNAGAEFDFGEALKHAMLLESESDGK